MGAAVAPGHAWRYGLLGLPLAFVSLPLYVNLPRHYAENLGMPLALLGGILLATRLLDAFIDPRIGVWVDRLFAHSTRRAWWAAVIASVALVLGFAGLWLPPALTADQLPLWLGMSLIVTYLGFSTVSIVHQAWAARWGGGTGLQSRVLAWREGFALAGVLLASVLPGWLGLEAMVGFMLMAVVIGLSTLSPRPSLGPTARAAQATGPALSPWGHRPFLALLVVFLLNGTASAIPATLLPFFVRDTLNAPQWEPVFLVSYFLAASLSLPLWVRLVRHHGAGRAWMVGMACSVLAFCIVPWLQAGDQWVFEAVCVITGLALGADLAIPGALLAGVIHQAGGGEQSEGRFIGWWTCATKLNLALASGITLPALGWLGFQTGAHTALNQQLLAMSYGVLPCVFKVLACLGLVLAMRRHAILEGHP